MAAGAAAQAETGVRDARCNYRGEWFETQQACTCDTGWVDGGLGGETPVAIKILHSTDTTFHGDGSFRYRQKEWVLFGFGPNVEVRLNVSGYATWSHTDQGQLKLQDNTGRLSSVGGFDAHASLRGSCLASDPPDRVYFPSYRIREVGVTLRPCNHSSVIRGIDLHLHPGGMMRGVTSSANVNRSDCIAGNCRLINLQGNDQPVANTKIILTTHGAAERVFQEFEILESQRCVIWDPDAQTTQPTVTTTTVATRTTHTMPGVIGRLDNSTNALRSELNAVLSTQDRLVAQVSRQQESIADLVADNTRLSLAVGTVSTTAESIQRALVNAVGQLPELGTEDDWTAAGTRPAVIATANDIAIQTPRGNVKFQTQTCGQLDICDLLNAIRELA